MKIIKAGVVPEPDTYVGICSYCKCEFQCKEHERPFSWGLWDFLLWVFNYQQRRLNTMDCPTCNKPVTVTKEQQ